MSGNSNDTEARKLIDAFVKQLINLNNGMPVPTHWGYILEGAIKKANKNVSSSKRGPKYSSEKAIELITKNFNEISKERTKHHNPATIKKEIADATGKSPRTITRYYEILSKIDSGDVEELNAETKEIFYSNIGKAILDEFFAEKTNST